MAESSPKKKRSSLKRKSGRRPMDWTGGGGVPSYAVADTKRIHVFRNGDIYHPGIRVVVNPRQVREMAPFLDLVNQRLHMIAGARKLYTTSGKEIKKITEIESDKEYVASPGHFTPLSYGQTLVRSASSFITSMTSSSLASQLARPSRSSEPRKSKSEGGGEKRKRPKSQAPPGTAPVTSDLSWRVKRAVSHGERKIVKTLSANNGDSTTKKIKKKMQNGVNAVKKANGHAQTSGKKVVKKVKKKAQNGINGIVDGVNEGKDQAVGTVSRTAATAGAAIGAVGGAIGGAVTSVLVDKEEGKGHHKDDHEGNKDSDKDEGSEKENEHEKEGEEDGDGQEGHPSRRHSRVSIKSAASKASSGHHRGSGTGHSDGEDGEDGEDGQKEDDDDHDEGGSKADSDDSKRTQTLSRNGKTERGK